MSIPQICPNCGESISDPHAADCCFGTPEYAHIGWPSYQVGAGIPDVVGGTESHWGKLQDSATAIRRLLDYLNNEPADPAESKEAVQPGPPSEFAFTAHAVLLLTKRSEELRKEAAGISLVEARKKREFTVDILESLIQELTE